MEITYDLIIKYLTNNKKNDFEIKKHLVKYSDTFPAKFNEILSNKFYYFGVTVYENKNNISFYMSLLTLLNKDFITLTDKEELEYLNSFKMALSKKIQNIDDINDTLFESICKVIDCNFIIFDFKNEEISSIAADTVLNPWKPTLLFANYDDIWYPILYDVNSKRLFCYNDQFIKKIYTCTKNPVEIMDNLKELVDEFNVKTNSTFIKVKQEDYTENSLKKLTKLELMEIIKNKNIKNVTTKTLKNDLIQIILSNI